LKALAAYQEFTLRAGDAIGEGRRSARPSGVRPLGGADPGIAPGATAGVTALTGAYQRARTRSSHQAPRAGGGPARQSRAAPPALEGADRREDPLIFSLRPLYTRAGRVTRGCLRSASLEESPSAAEGSERTPRGRGGTRRHPGPVGSDLVDREEEGHLTLAQCVEISPSSLATRKMLWPSVISLISARCSSIPAFSLKYLYALRTRCSDIPPSSNDRTTLRPRVTERVETAHPGAPAR